MRMNVISPGGRTRTGGTEEHDSGENVWNWAGRGNKRSFVMGAVLQISQPSNQ
jgi:hypothetical protein